ncbi:MAG TPA: GNAT family protein [Candidatus Limnocylindrales bacterium]|jgi:RimJ/RimL family protein N-acetyltransferase
MTKGAAARELLPFHGERVLLRDVRREDADLLDEWNAALEPDSFNDFGPRAPTDRDALARGPLRNERNGTLIIERIEDSQPLGTIAYRRVSFGPPPNSDAWQLGIDLAAEARGQGYGTEAQRLLADWLFATTPANRVEAATDIENVAEQRSLEKAGYVREGVLRGSQFRAGAYHDLVYYSRLRDDP